jgi:hypothetical protein
MEETEAKKPPVRCGIKRIVLLNLLFLLVGLGLVDYVYGELSGVAAVMEDARKFRSEAVFLRTSTRVLVPGMVHEYPDPYRPEGNSLIPQGGVRRFETTPLGTVSSGLPRTDSGHRILFLGGSTTECNEVDEPLRFPAVVAKTLTNDGTATITINAGVRGHTTLDAINTFLNRPNLGPVDVVVLMENINDRLLLAVRGQYGAKPDAAIPTSFAAVVSPLYEALQAAGDYLMYRSNILFFFQDFANRFGNRNDLRGGWITERTLNDLPLPTLALQTFYEQNLRVFVAVVRAEGKKPILMTQPLARRSAAQDLFNERIRFVAEATGATLIDLDNEFPSDREWAFLDDSIHMTNQGSLVAGQIIAAHLAPLL